MAKRWLHKVLEIRVWLLSIGASLVLVSVIIDWIQPRAESAFAASQPTTQWDDVARWAGLLGAVFVLVGTVVVIVTNGREKRRLNDLQSDMRNMKELIPQLATKDDLDRIKQIVLEKRSGDDQ